MKFGTATQPSLRSGKTVALFGALAALSTSLYFGSVTVRALSKEPKGITVDDVQKHTTPETGVWVVVNGQVYDLTDFYPRHPGGADIILQYAGKNASLVFNRYHAANFVDKYLEPEQHLGPLVGEMEPAPDVTTGPVDEDEEEQRQEYLDNMPEIDHIMNVNDFEYIAEKILPANAWSYYSTAAEDGATLSESHNAYSRIFFKPRVMRDVSGPVDLETSFLGVKSPVPFYCSATAQARLGHPDGELSIARACGADNVIQMISNFSSYPLEDIAGQVKGQTQWFQLYVESDHEVTKQRIASALAQPTIKGIFVTVDTAFFGRREKDLRLRALSMTDTKSKDLSKAVVYDLEHVVTWPKLKEYNTLAGDTPVVLKGVQCAEDVVEAAENGVKAVVLSNHGGRQLDFSPAPVQVLAEAMPMLRERGLDKKIEIYIDGGIRRGSDIVKALCLGARGVGLGRPYLYSNTCYGEEGVRKLHQLLITEMVITMKLLGVTSVKQLGPEYVDLRGLYQRESTPPPTQTPGNVPKFQNEY